MPITSLGDIAILPPGDTTFVPLYTPARDAPISVGEGAVAVPPSRMDPAPLVTEPYRLSKSPQTIQAWRTHVQPPHSEYMPPVNIQSWGIAHARPWETSSELVVHTTYTTPNLGGESIFTRDIVASDVTSTLVPSVRPSVLPYATGPVAAWPVRPAEATTGPEPAAQRSRSRTPIARPSTPLLRRQPSMIVTDPTPLAPPPSPIPNLSQYLGSDDDSLPCRAYAQACYRMRLSLLLLGQCAPLMLLLDRSLQPIVVVVVHQ